MTGRPGLLEHSICLALSGIVDIGVVQQFLDAQQDLTASGQNRWLLAENPEVVLV